MRPGMTESVANLRRELLMVQREAQLWREARMEKVVLNAMIHTELKFLTWIFQASRADRTAKWQSGWSGQLG